MKALVIYDSIFGNTEKIAQAIAPALGGADDVGMVKIGEAKLEQLAGLKLLVVGSPTRGFRPTPALTAFLVSIPPNSLAGMKTAAFDTSLSVGDIKSPILRWLAKWAGYAAKPINEQLIKKGGSQAATPEGFAVAGTEGPLKDGELERAAAWAMQIVWG
jgi:flavodoxin I